MTYALLGLPARPAWAGSGWIPPRTVTALLPSATFAPGTTHPIQMTLRANGAPAELNWFVTTGGAFLLGVTPMGGSISVPAESIRTVTFSVTVPPNATGAGTMSVFLSDQIGGGHIGKAPAVISSTGVGRPEIWPVPGTWSATANTSGAITFQIHSTRAVAESLEVLGGRVNPDPNNDGGLFPGSPLPDEVLLPAGGNVTISAPTRIAGNAYSGIANALTCSVASDSGLSSAVGYALVSAALPESLPVTLYPTGLIPMGDPTGGRDGSVELSARGLWLVPAGLDGVRVMIAGSSLSRIGLVDLDWDAADDRLVGRVRIPSYAAALAVVPGFVGPAGDTLDLGLLAAGRAGLMLIDLRTIVDPPMIAWEDFFDQDANGIDDRILRTIPMPGFATDVAWFRAPTGRIVALVAAADTGSVPVRESYNPASVVAGTGAGVVAIDVTAAIDSLGGVPYAAGTLATPGSALDLELRRMGAGEPDLAVADGAAGVSVYHLTTATGPPAAVTFTLSGAVALSSAWGTPYARDLSWIANRQDSLYLGVAASAGGLQIVRAPASGPPLLVMSQQTSAPAIGLDGAWTGHLGVALGAGGVALMRVPGGGELGQISPTSAAPYTAPVTRARGQLWTEGALEIAAHSTPGSAATSMRFLSTPGVVPDLLVSDGQRALLLRPGLGTIVGVEEASSPPRAVPLAISVTPNPMGGSAVIRVFDASARLNGAATEVVVFDVQGRLVRRFRGAVASGDAGAASLVRLTWDGRDDRGRRLSSGRYWLRVRAGARTATRPVLILR